MRVFPSVLTYIRTRTGGVGFVIFGVFRGVNTWVRQFYGKRKVVFFFFVGLTRVDVFGRGNKVSSGNFKLCFGGFLYHFCVTIFNKFVGPHRRLRTGLGTNTFGRV